MTHTLDGKDLGAVTSEEWRKSQPLIVLDAFTDTSDTTAVSLLGVTRRISIRGSKKFANKTQMNEWIASIDVLVKPFIMSSVRYVSAYYSPYPVSESINVLVEDFSHTKEGGEELPVVHYSLELLEAKGVSDV